jgi:hypothetical protein
VASAACSRATSAARRVQHRALVDVALVGDLARVEARRLGEHQRARRALRRTRAFVAQCAQHAGDAFGQRLGCERCGLRAGKHQHADLVAVVAR